MNEESRDLIFALAKKTAIALEKLEKKCEEIEKRLSQIEEDIEDLS